MREFLFSDQERDDINHLRALLEVECCRLACLNATDAELEKLCRTAEEFCRNEELLIEESDPNQAIDVFDEILDCDVSFHHQLYIMSGNKLYINLFFLMEDAIRNNLKWHIKTRIKLHEPLITADRHLTIAQALVKRDFETCKELYPLLVGVEE